MTFWRLSWLVRIDFTNLFAKNPIARDCFPGEHLTDRKNLIRKDHVYEKWKYKYLNRSIKHTIRLVSCFVVVGYKLLGTISFNSVKK